MSGATGHVYPSLWDRFWAKVDASGDCWEWTGAKLTQGYGHFGVRAGVHRSAHRVAWELLIGPIPDGLEIDHLCRNRSCVNTDHLEPVTRRVNQTRGFGLAGRRARRTQCPQGHPYDATNTVLSKRNQRNCRECARQRRAERNTREKRARHLARGWSV